MPTILHEFHDPHMLHRGHVSAVLFLRDGRLISRDGEEVILWNTKTGMPQARFNLVESSSYRAALRLTPVENQVICFPSSQGQPVQVLQIGANEITEVFQWDLGEDETESVFAAWDGKRMVVATQQKVVVIDAESGKQILQADSPVEFDDVNKVVVSGDGKWAAFTDSENGSVSIIDTTTGKVAKKIKPKQLVHDYEPNMEVSPDGRFLEFFHLKEYKVKLHQFSFDDQGTKVKTATEHSSGISRQWSSHDNSLTIMEKMREGLTLVNRETGDTKTLLKAGDPKSSVAISPDNQTWAMTQGKRVVQIKFETGEKITEITGPSWPFRDLIYLSATGELLSKQYNDLIEVDPASGQSNRTLPIPHSLGIMQNRYIISRKARNYVRYDAIERTVRRVTDQDFPYFEISDFNFVSADYTNKEDTQLQTWSFDGVPGIRFCPYDSDSFPDALSIFPSGKRIAFIRNEEMQVWDTETGEKLLSRKEIEASEFIISPDEKWILATDYSAPLRLLKAENLEEIWSCELDGFVSEAVFSPESSSLLLNNGKGLHFIEVETGEIKQVMELEGRIESFCMGPEAKLYVSMEDTRLLTVDASDLLKDTLPGPLNLDELNEKFFDWEANEDLGETELRQLLETANWDAFRPEVDLVPLRRALAALQEAGGPGELHKAISAKILPEHGRLLHRFGHLSQMISHGISPDGKWLATGSWVGDDYEAGGELMVWEVATGRCVNLVLQVEGGIAWPDYPNCIQWSPNSKLLGIAYNTNSVGSFDPFAPDRRPLADVCVTDGWSRPPAWCWAPDSRQIMVACWGGDSPVPGCIAPMDHGDLYEKDVRWFAFEIPDSVVPDDEESLELQPFRQAFWSKDGKLIFGYNNHNQCFAIDAESGEMKWFSDIGEPVAFDPDDQHFAHNLAGFLFYETQTGLPTFKLPMIVGVTHAWWSPVPGQQRIAAMVTKGNNFDADPGVHIYEHREFLCSLDTVPRRNSYGDGADASSWAWSPDGQKAAVRTDSEVQIWNIQADPVIEINIAVDSRIVAIEWGADNTLVGVAPELLEFYDIGTGKLKSRYDMHLPEGVTRPPLYSAPLAELDEKFPDRYQVQPCASILHEGSQHWVVAYEDGKVVCPPDLQSRLSEELSYSVGGRYAWPIEWTDMQIAPDLATATSEWNLPYDLAVVNAEPAPKNREDYFMACNVNSPQEPWSKKDFKDIRKESEVQDYWMPTREPGAYEASTVFKGEDVTAENLRPLIGKVVLYAEDYDPNRAQTGALMAIDDGRAMIIYHNESTMGTSWSSLEDLIYIGEAEPR